MHPRKTYPSTPSGKPSEVPSKNAANASSTNGSSASSPSPTSRVSSHPTEVRPKDPRSGEPSSQRLNLDRLVGGGNRLVLEVCTRRVARISHSATAEARRVLDGPHVAVVNAHPQPGLTRRLTLMPRPPVGPQIQEPSHSSTPKRPSRRRRESVRPGPAFARTVCRPTGVWTTRSPEPRPPRRVSALLACAHRNDRLEPSTVMRESISLAILGR